MQYSAIQGYVVGGDFCDRMLAHWRQHRHYNFMVAGSVFYGVLLAAGYGT